MPLCQAFLLDEVASFGVPNSPDERWAAYPRWQVGLPAGVQQPPNHAVGAANGCCQRPNGCRLLSPGLLVWLPLPACCSTSHCRYILEATQHEMLISEDLTQDMR